MCLITFHVERNGNKIPTRGKKNKQRQLDPEMTKDSSPCPYLSPPTHPVSMT